MITEIVTFRLPNGMTHDDVVANFEKTAPNWKANPDLIRKNYLVDVENGLAGGVYLWKDRAHAEKWHGEAFRNKVKEIYGSEPEIQFFETPIVVDNSAGTMSKKLFEFANREELLRGWLLHAHKGRDRHDLAARRNDTYRYWLGVPTVILATVVGTSVFASLEKTTVDSNLIIALGLASIASAVLASLQTFYDFGSRAESHRLAGVKYKAVVRELEQVLTQSLDQLPKKDDFFDALRKRLDVLEAEAPVVPEGIYRQIEKRYANVVFSDNVASFVM
jgi:hypothetical protein